MHRIEQHDMVDAREATWHRQELINVDLTLDNTRLRQMQPCVGVVIVRLPDGQLVETDWRWQAGIDSNAVHGVPYNPDTYKPLDVQQWLDVIADATSGSGLILNTIGTLRNRGRMFACFEVPGTRPTGTIQFVKVIADLEKQIGLRCSSGTNRVVCDNTAEQELRDVQGNPVTAKVKYTKGAPERIENWQQLVDTAHGVGAAYLRELETLQSVPFDSVASGKELVAGLLVNGRLTTRSANVCERIATLASRGAGNSGTTLADVEHGITDYYTHESAGQDRAKQWLSSEFGSAAAIKRESHGKLLTIANRNAIDTTVDTGKRLFADYLAKATN